MRCQMMRVISSPSISTTGFLTAIFAMAAEPLPLVFARADVCRTWGGMPPGQAPYGAPRRLLQGLKTSGIYVQIYEGVPASCPATQSSLRRLRKLVCAAGHPRLFRLQARRGWPGQERVHARLPTRY